MSSPVSCKRWALGGFTSSIKLLTGGNNLLAQFSAGFPQSLQSSLPAPYIHIHYQVGNSETGPDGCITPNSAVCSIWKPLIRVISFIKLCGRKGQIQMTYSPSLPGVHHRMTHTELIFTQQHQRKMVTAEMFLPEKVDYCRTKKAGKGILNAFFE